MPAGDGRQCMQIDATNQTRAGGHGDPGRCLRAQSPHRQAASLDTSTTRRRRAMAV